jgi:aminoglycoside phosphotransferase (APT) family kinase protein
MSDEVDAAAVSSAPKFHKDRSGYAAALSTWFARAVPGATDIEISALDIPVASGFSNETVMFTTSWTEDGVRHEERMVGRIEPADGGLFPPQTPAATVSVLTQHRAMRAVAAHGSAPVPDTVGYEPDPSLLGGPFFVMRFIDGRVPGDQPRYTQAGFVVDEATPADRKKMVETGLAAMASLHAIDWRTAGLEWLDISGNGTPTTAHQLELYRKLVAHELRGRPHPVMSHALDWLEANDPHDDRIGLSWGDARMGNIIWQDYEPAAVVDWEACAVCPTEADIGWWLMFDRMSFDDLDTPRLEGYPTREEMIAHYEAVSGREVRAAHYWEVFAVMRFAAIFIRLADRMVATGVFPAELNASVANQPTDALARLLGIDNPTPPLF